MLGVRFTGRTLAFSTPCSQANQFTSLSLGFSHPHHDPHHTSRLPCGLCGFPLVR